MSGAVGERPAYAQSSSYGQQAAYVSPSPYGAGSSPGGYGPTRTPYRSQPRPRWHSRHGKALSGVVAVVVAGVVVAVTGWPFAAASSKPQHTTAALTKVLLTSDQISATTGGAFTVNLDNSDDSSDDTSDDCPAADALDGKDQTAQAEGDREFTSGAGLVVDEDITYTPGKAATMFSQLRTALGECHSMTVEDNTKLTMTLVPVSVIAGSDDTIAIQATGVFPGNQEFTIRMESARYGDTVVGIVYGGLTTPAAASGVADRLLQQATGQAKSVL
ncbi:MAG TPA: hypothetical protein VHZ96_19840 [Frankiaceae bacterium]|nr:hypothetical protein [Frankiaceae bacterium]